MGENGTAANVRACPRCARRDVTPLAVEGDKQRFQCSCGEAFWGATLEAVTVVTLAEGSTSPVRIAHAPIAAPEPGDVVGSDGEVKGRCGKCGKPYYRLGKRYEEHVASCDGSVKYVEPAPRRAAAAPAADPLKAMDGTTRRAIETSILALKAQRSALEGEILGINSAIATLEKIHGPGGAEVPFGGGA